MRRRALLVGAAAAAAGALPVPAEAQGAPQRILFIGNSLTYTNNLPGMLAAIYQIAGLQLAVDMVARPGFSLTDHWQDHDARRAIEAGGWSVVVLQQGPSSFESSRAQLRRRTRLFAGLIREVGAVPALFSAWPSRTRQRDFARAAESYALAASDVDGLLLPVANAWSEALRSTPEIRLYSPDGVHPTREGSMLAALVMFGVFSERSPLSLPPSGGSLALQQAAATVLGAH